MPSHRSPFPDPACRLPDEYPMLAAVLAAPLDDLPKLVYADWLEEHADPRGPFLRQWVTFRKEGQGNPKPPRGAPKSWLSVIRHTLAAAIEYSPTWDEAVWQTAEPGILVQTKPPKEEPIPVGVSKMGGLPDLPPDAEWPDGENSPAAFVAQWNLEELAASPVCRALPKTGLLSFFIDLAPFVEDSGDGVAKVVYTPTLDGLEEREPDEERAEENVLRECRLEFREWLTLPHRSSPALEAFRLPQEVMGDYMDFYYTFDSPRSQHQILGHAMPIQSDPTPIGESGWRLLTQFGPDENLTLEACDGGTWFFMTRPGRSKVWKFNATHMEFQTG